MLLFPFIANEKYYVYLPVLGEVWNIDRNVLYEALKLLSSLRVEMSVSVFKKKLVDKTAVSEQDWKGVEELILTLQTPQNTRFLKRSEINKRFYREKEIIEKRYNETLKIYRLGKNNDAISGKLILNLTDRCNFKCKYCVERGDLYYEPSDRCLGKMTREIGFNAIQDFLFQRKRSVVKEVEIVFFGGEPLIEMNLLVDLIEFAKKTHKGLSMRPCLVLKVATNGTLLNKTNVRYFVKENICLQISLDGPKEIHDKFRHNIAGLGTFKAVSKAVRMLKREAFEMRKFDYFSKCVFFIGTFTDNADKEKIKNFFLRTPLLVSLHGKRAMFFLNAISPCGLKDCYSFIERKTTALENYDSIKKDINSLKDSNVPRDYKISIQRRLNYFCEKNAQKFLTPSPRKEPCVLSDKLCNIVQETKTFVESDGTIYFCSLCKIKELAIGSYADKGIDFERIKIIMQEYLQFGKKCYSCPIQPVCSLCYRDGNVNGQKYFFPHKNSKNCVDNFRRVRENFSFFYGLIDVVPEFKVFYERWLNRRR